jgi:hypothetical protein
LWKQSATGVLLAFGQEIVSGAEHRSEQQVEVGEHLGPPWVGVRLTPPTSTALLPNPAAVLAPGDSWNYSSRDYFRDRADALETPQRPETLA